VGKSWFYKKYFVGANALVQTELLRVLFKANVSLAFVRVVLYFEFLYIFIVDGVNHIEGALLGWQFCEA
jgi:hypothetical protein